MCRLLATQSYTCSVVATIYRGQAFISYLLIQESTLLWKSFAKMKPLTYGLF